MSSLHNRNLCTEPTGNDNVIHMVFASIQSSNTVSVIDLCVETNNYYYNYGNFHPL